MFTAIGIITTIFVAKIAMRAMHYRFHRRHGGFGGGCGWGHRRWHARWQRGPFDLGAYDQHDFNPEMDERFDMRPQYPRQYGAAPRVETILKSLELNDRQTAEASDVLAILRGIVSVSGGERSQIALALRAASRPQFDADLAAAAIGPRLSPASSKEALDALEHLHTILTEEQRQALDRATARS